MKADEIMRHVTCVRNDKCITKHKRKHYHGRPKCKWEKNAKIYLTEI
jgi:hypothetical protein